VSTITSTVTYGLSIDTPTAKIISAGQLLAFLTTAEVPSFDQLSFSELAPPRPFINEDGYNSGNILKGK
jgi:hypothetical protein